MNETLKNDSVVLIRLQAMLSDREQAELSQLLEGKIKKYGKIRLFLVLEDYPMIDSAESLYEDMNFIKLHADGIERMAVVGERAWQETWIALFGLFSGVETAYFEPPERKKATKWISE